MLDGFGAGQHPLRTARDELQAFFQPKLKQQSMVERAEFVHQPDVRPVKKESAHSPPGRYQSVRDNCVGGEILEHRQILSQPGAGKRQVGRILVQFRLRKRAPPAERGNECSRACFLQGSFQRPAAGQHHHAGNAVIFGQFAHKFQQAAFGAAHRPAVSKNKRSEGF